MCIRDRTHTKDLGVEMAAKQFRNALVEEGLQEIIPIVGTCLLYTSDAADERSSVDLGGRRIIKKKNSEEQTSERTLRRKK